MFDLVVVHHHAPSTLHAQLARFSGWSVAPRSITVVDNSASDGTTALLRTKLDAGVRILECPGNPGYGAAVNRAFATVRDSEPKYVLVTTQDAIYDEAAISSLVAYLESDPRAGAAAPLLTYSSDPERVFSAGGMTDSKAQCSHLGSGSCVHEWAGRPPYEVPWADGAILLLRKEALAQVGGFDERYFLYFEEVDLQLRLRLAGWSVRVVPQAVCSQEPGNFNVYLRVRNRALLQRSFPFAFDQRPRVEIVDALRTLTLGLVRREWSAPRQVLRALRDVRRERFGNPATPEKPNGAATPKRPS
jgi:N-acetylglucosaminyl-diphospho-decaprenol L-rhamnosyltransferase